MYVCARDLEVRSAQQQEQFSLVILQRSVLQLLRQLAIRIRKSLINIFFKRSSREVDSLNGHIIITLYYVPLYYKHGNIEGKLHLHPPPDRRRCAGQELGSVSRTASVSHESEKDKRGNITRQINLYLQAIN